MTSGERISSDPIKAIAAVLEEHPTWSKQEAQTYIDRTLAIAALTDDEITAKVTQTQHDARTFFGWSPGNVDPEQFFPENSVVREQMKIQPAYTKFPRQSED